MTCVCVCVPRYRGIWSEEEGFDVHEPIRWNNIVVFEWHARGTDFDETSLVKPRCDNVVERHVPLPSSWRTALRCLRLDDLATRCAARAQEGGIQDALCIVLGQPKGSPLPEPDATLLPGALTGTGR